MSVTTGLILSLLCFVATCLRPPHSQHRHTSEHYCICPWHFADLVLRRQMPGEKCESYAATPWRRSEQHDDGDVHGAVCDERLHQPAPAPVATHHHHARGAACQHGQQPMCLQPDLLMPAGCSSLMLRDFWIYLEQLKVPIAIWMSALRCPRAYCRDGQPEVLGCGHHRAREVLQGSPAAWRAQDSRDCQAC